MNVIVNTEMVCWAMWFHGGLYIICRLDCNNGKGTADMMSSMMPSADKELSVRISYVNFRNN